MGLMLYNMGAGILRAVGDSKRPFYFLVAAAVLNIGLDLLLVIVFHMGVEGVAYATIISQGVSALLTLLLLVRTSSCVKLDWRALRATPFILKQIARVGIPAALQMAITAFSNVFVQSYINFFQADCMSAGPLIRRSIRSCSCPCSPWPWPPPPLWARIWAPANWTGPRRAPGPPFVSLWASP